MQAQGVARLIPAEVFTLRLIWIDTGRPGLAPLNLSLASLLSDERSVTLERLCPETLKKKAVAHESSYALPQILLVFRLLWDAPTAVERKAG